MSNSKGYSAPLTITANKLFVIRTTAYTQKLMKRVADNDLPNMPLSYDIMGQPNEVTITVYANVLMWHLHIPAFRVKV